LTCTRAKACPTSLLAVLTREPDWKALPASTPPGLLRLLRRCLEREPRRRLHDIADSHFDLEDSAQPPSHIQNRYASSVALFVSRIAADGRRWQDVHAGTDRSHAHDVRRIHARSSHQRHHRSQLKIRGDRGSTHVRRRARGPHGREPARFETLPPRVRRGPA
jgi:hypothetical protein